MEEPGEEWKCAERINTCIGTGSVSMANLLDGNSELTDCINMSITDSSTVCALFQSDIKGTAMEDPVTEIQWSMKCHCELRKIQTVSDLKILH